MKKMPTIFVRDYATTPALVINTWHQDCLWVRDGEGVATQKLDGACCMIQDGVLYKRREVKPGKPEPEGFVLVDEDEKTGKKVGWVLVGDGPEDQPFRDGLEWLQTTESENHKGVINGTYELCGPKVQGDAEGLRERHMLFRHDNPRLILSSQPRRTFEAIGAYLTTHNIEGIVWHHEDGRRAKIKGKDFGANRKDFFG